MSNGLARNSRKNDAASMLGGGENQYLVFELEDEEYGVEILQVQEIRGWERPTPIPNMPDYVKGVIDLRGTIVPIVDMRLKFHLSNVEYSDRTVVVVLRIENKMMGMVVDGVSDVLGLSNDQIKPAPQFSMDNNSEDNRINAEYLEGLVTIVDRMVILVNVEKLLSGKDMVLVSQMFAESAEEAMAKAA